MSRPRRSRDRRWKCPQAPSRNWFHRSGTEGDFDGLQGGEKVSFEIESSPKGPRAKSVRIA
ncbi:MAG: hypothetical protein E6J06_09530 [Chloroflexi bacterium]|nr:MAG: hypothetical protein E6J06_09530 [Chloroflexota bacterium]